MDPVLAKLVDLGIAGLALLGMWKLYRTQQDLAAKRDAVLMEDARKREDQLRQELDRNRAECREENRALTARLQSVEDREAGMSTAVLQACTRAIENYAEASRTNAEAFRRLTESGSHTTQG